MIFHTEEREPICAVFLLSSTVILTHANHTHDHYGPGGSCAACEHVVAAGKLFKICGTALITSVAMIYGSLAVISAMRSGGFHAGLITLVSLKVRMND